MRSARLEFKFSADSELAMAERHAHRVSGTRPNVLETFQGPATLANGARKTAMLVYMSQDPTGWSHPSQRARNSRYLAATGQNLSPTRRAAVRSMPAGWNCYILRPGQPLANSNQVICSVILGSCCPRIVQWWNHFSVTTCLTAATPWKSPSR